MKIVFLISVWKKTHGTGVTRYLINLIDELKKDVDLNISVIFMEGHDEENYIINSSKFKFPIKAISILIRIKPDVIYVGSNWFFLLTGVIYKKIWGTKLVATFHSHPDPLPFYGKCLMKYLLNQCDIVTYVSKNLADKIKEVYLFPINVREEITYAGVRSVNLVEDDIKDFKCKYKIKENSIILLMHSSPIAKVKSDGTKILMEAVRKLLPEYPDILLIITGDGPHLDELMEYSIKIKIKDHMIFTGWIDNPYVPLSICNIYTHISLGEGLPLALLEAMSFGKPIIATPVGGIPEIIINMKNGILVEPDPVDIANSIETILSNEKIREALAEKALVDSKKYSWEMCANKYKEIFYSKE